MTGDFFDEDWEEPSSTQETAVTRPTRDGARAAAEAPVRDGTPRPRRRPPRLRPGGGGPRGPTGGRPQLEYGRLAALAAGIIVVVAVLVFAARSCGGGNAARDRNQAYFDAAKPALLRVDAAGRQFADTLRASRVKRSQVEARLQTQLGEVNAALKQLSGLDPTKELQPYQPALLQSLRYRVNGLQCMIAALPTAYRRHRLERSGAPLVPCTQRLLASDVIYADSFYTPSVSALRDADAGVGVPTSQFLASSLEDVVTPRGMGQFVQRWRVQKTVKGLHGLQLDSVTANPGNGGATVSLQPGKPTTVRGSDNLVFVVKATNGGGSLETNVPVRVILRPASGGSTNDIIRKSATIQQIQAGTSASVQIGGIFSAGNAPQFTVPYKLTVIVTPVPGERNPLNNRETYDLNFTVG